MSPINLIDAQLLNIACPEQSPSQLTKWVQPIKNCCIRFDIDTVREVACLLGQAGHESGGLTKFEEDLRYSAKRLMQVWPKRFSSSLAQECAYKPEKIANIVYANRMGNGPPESGDGWKYRGYGPFQLTGKRNQMACADHFKVHPMSFPAWLRTDAGAWMSAGWFFWENDLDRLAATPGVEDETQAINGGQHGIDDRRNRFDRVLKELLRRGAK